MKGTRTTLDRSDETADHEAEDCEENILHHLLEFIIYRDLPHYSLFDGVEVHTSSPLISASYAILVWSLSMNSMLRRYMD